METIQLTKGAQGIWTCTLNRPEKLNALSRKMIEELTECFQEVAAATMRMECRVFLLNSATPKAFCVGADLAERRGMDEKQVGQTLDALRVMTRALEKIPAPTIAIVEGAAFGGGLELALCCDMRVARPSALLGLTETRLAIIPGAGGTQRLARLVGIARAKEFIFSGRRLSGEEAEIFGVVNACEDDAAAWALRVATEISEGGPLAVLAAKEAIEKGFGRSLEEGLDCERACYEKTLYTSDRVEGLKAFDEKRKPHYQGR
jgi:enoyl-CoA hydratase/carnithine racemase